MPDVRPTRWLTAARTAGVATTMAAGALTVVMMTPQTAAAGPVVSSPVQLLSTANPLQPEINQLLDTQQQMETDESQYPFVTSSDLPMAHEYAQNALLTMATTKLVELNFSLGHVGVAFAPYPFDAPATNMQQVLVYANPDDQYTALPISPEHQYTITVDPPTGPNGTGDLTFLLASGDGVETPYDSLTSSDLAKDFIPNSDGTYTITLSSTPESGNWIDIPADADKLIMRDSLGNWGLPHDAITFSEQGVGPTSLTDIPLLTNAQMASIMGAVASSGANELASPDYLGQLDVTNSPPANTLSPIQPTDTFMPGPLLTGDNQYLSAGDFSLQPDQALIVKVPEIDAGYSSAMVSNAYGQTAPAATATGSLDDAQAFHDPDGFTYYVISSQNPGVANWLNDDGLTNGGIWLRFEGLANPPTTPTPVTTQVVNVADVQQYLPVDTPTVSPAEYAADAQLRLFEWDYAHDQNENTGWLGANLEYDQFKAAMGAQEFSEVFGGQSTYYGAPQEIPTVLDRMTDPSLIPNLATIVNDIQADPSGAMLAIKDNLSVAANDIERSIELALLRLEVLFEQTSQAVHGDISSGQSSQLAADLGTFLQGLGTVFNETLTDPTTSVTAGILNARDDLAVSIMNASSYSTSSSASTSFSDSLSQLVQAMSQALNPSTELADFSTLSTEITAQFAAPGADAASSIAGSLSDVLP